MANKKLSKRYEAILRAYQNSNLTCLHECYGSWSWAKEHAYNYCKGLCDRMNGYDFKIVSYNTNMFSIAFLYQSDGKTMLHYETNKTTLDIDVSGHIYTYEDFEDDYNNLSDETKQHLTNSGVCVHSMGEAEDERLFDDGIYRAYSTDRLKTLFLGYSHLTYSHGNAQEIVYKDVSLW